MFKKLLIALVATSALILIPAAASAKGGHGHGARGGHHGHSGKHHGGGRHGHSRHGHRGGRGYHRGHRYARGGRSFGRSSYRSYAWGGYRRGYSWRTTWRYRTVYPVAVSTCPQPVQPVDCGCN